MRLRGRVLTDSTETSPRIVVVDDREVAAILPDDGGPVDRETDGWIAPGFLDLQINGGYGIDLASEADAESAVAALARHLVRHGVTAFCPTLVTSDPATILRRLPAMRPRLIEGGATSLGAHIEGPFLSARFPGIHDRRFIRPPAPDEVRRWFDVGDPTIVTLAPEIEGAHEVISFLAGRGCVVSAGHTAATAYEASAGVAAGITMATHLFNAMPPLHHREPGAVGTLLAADVVRVGMLADGVHVAAQVVAFIARAIGPERLFLVSDAIAAAGAAPGPVRLGEQTVISDGRVVRRADGTLSGSAMMLDEGVRNARAWLPWLLRGQIVDMASRTPARALNGRAGRRGRIAPGWAADLVMLDRAFGVEATIVTGRVAYDAAQSPNGGAP
ncbi:MAG: N-acetylglucosamine-6-phosphate deacetylase [Chloroflexi bacterium]|nr:N-acetylglucosamine-6-phosphate deacetylase [Chloroflexota bacterium]